MKPYTIAYHHATWHGVLTAVHIPDSRDPVPEPILNQLAPAERAIAKEYGGYRQVQFVGGRLALRHACLQLGTTPVALTSTPRGAPILPKGLAGSISHKRALAVGLVTRDRGFTVGVDLEEYGPARLSIINRVLTEEEISTLEGLGDEERWISTVLRFSIKEAIYKALDPWVQRYVDYKEAIVHTDLEGGARVRLALKQDEGPFEVDVRYTWLRGRIVSTARIRLAQGADHPVPSRI